MVRAATESGSRSRLAAGLRAVGLALRQQLAHLAGVEQAGDAEEVHLLLRAHVHLALVAELAAVVEHPVEAGLRPERLERQPVLLGGRRLPRLRLGEQVALGGEDVGLVGDRAAEHVVALDLHLGGVLQQRRHRRQEHRRGLAARPGTHEAADRLGEEQRGRGRGRVDADREPRDVDALRHHPDRDHPAPVALGELHDLAGAGLLVREHHRGRLARDAAQQLGVGAGGLLVARDHQPARVGDVAAYLRQPPVGGRQHLRDPRAARVQRGAQRLRGEVLGERLAEPGGDLVAGAGAPLQVAGVGEEQHRAHDVVGERVARSRRSSRPPIAGCRRRRARR